MRATPAPMEGRAQRARQESTTLQREVLLARTVVQGNTGLLQDRPLKHRVRSVPRTRTRLLKAVLKPPVPVMQATVVTLAQAHAQRVLQASTNLQEAMVIARFRHQAQSQAS